ncbi:MAG: HAD family hydrolase [Candidatus Nanopelagicales bacterium]
MSRKAVFLDVDGTLVNDRGLVPDSAQQAVHLARDNGHLVFLCTGRSMSELWPEIIEIGFDGVVAAAGGYVETGGKVLAEHHIPVEEVRRVTEFFDSLGVDYFLESNTGLFGSPGVQARLRHLIFGPVADEDVLAELERGLGGFIDSVVVGADPESIRINKVSFLDSPVTLAEIRAEFADVFDVIPATVPMFGSNSGELSLRGVHKAAGIEVLIGHLGIDRADTMAIGDGYNDLEMLQHVAIGIAMGNAPQQVKDVADEVTVTPDEHGIHASFAKHGLI